MAIALFQNYSHESYNEAYALFSKYSDCGANVSISSMDEVTTLIAIFPNEEELHCVEGNLNDHEKADYDLQRSAWERAKNNIKGILQSEGQEPTGKLVERLAIEMITGGAVPGEIAEQYKAQEQKTPGPKREENAEHA